MDELHADNETLLTWWQQSLDNDTASFGCIHATLFNGLYNYASKLLNDDELADDAVQELFIKIWNKRPSIGTIQQVKPFFYTVLRRQVFNQLRDLKLRKLKISLIAQSEIEFSQEEILIKKEQDNGLKEKLLALLNTLPRRQREVMYLHYFENLSLKQISAVMDINHQSVMNLKQRALQKMRTTKILSFVLLFCSLINI